MCAPVYTVTFKMAGRWRNSSGGKSCRRTSLTKLNDLATTPGSSLKSRLHGTVDQTWPTILHTRHTPSTQPSSSRSTWCGAHRCVTARTCWSLLVMTSHERTVPPHISSGPSHPSPPLSSTSTGRLSDRVTPEAESIPSYLHPPLGNTQVALLGGMFFGRGCTKGEVGVARDNCCCAFVCR